MLKTTPTESHVSKTWFEILSKQERPVMIYQMGKVGSSALEKSIPDAIHIHDLMAISSDQQISPVQAKLDRPLRRHVKRFMKKWLFINMLRTKQEVKIITLVRDPIGRNISMFFQSLPFWMAEKYIDDDAAVRSERPQLLYETFEQHVNHDYPLHWFDKELKPLTGIDVYSEQFDTDAGYRIFKNKNFSVLVARMDKLAELDTAISDFVGHPIEIVRENQSDNKWYSPLAKDFKAHFVAKPEFVEKMLGSKLANHFYTPTEIDKFRKKYQKEA